MNLLFFLTPKATCCYLYADYTLRQAMERMEHSGYSALPILTREGTYCGTLTEGDLLWPFADAHGADENQQDSQPKTLQNRL